MRDIRAHSLTSTYAYRYVYVRARYIEVDTHTHTHGDAVRRRRRGRGRIVSIVRGGACRGPDFPSFTHGHCCSDVRPLARVIVTRALRTKTRFIMFSSALRSVPFYSIPSVVPIARASARVRHQRTRDRERSVCTVCTYRDSRITERPGRARPGLSPIDKKNRVIVREQNCSFSYGASHLSRRESLPARFRNVFLTMN